MHLYYNKAVQAHLVTKVFGTFPSAASVLRLKAARDKDVNALLCVPYKTYIWINRRDRQKQS